MMARIWPAMLLLLATLLACLPWRLPPELQLAAPFLPVAAAAHGLACRGDWLPDWAFAAAGLAVDVALQGPLGFWPLVYLAAHAMTLLPGAGAEDDGALRALGPILVIAATGAVAWALRSLYDWSAFSIRPIVGAAGVAIAVYGIAVIAAGIGNRAQAHADGS